MSARRPGPLLINLLIGVLCLVWGSTWVVIQEGLEDLPPFTSLGLRFVVAFAVFAVIARPLHRWEGGARPPLRLVLVMGLLTDALSYGIIYWSERTVPSGLTCVLWGVYPILIALAGHLWLPGERLGLGSVLGFALGFVGVATLFSNDLREISDAAMAAGSIVLLSPLVTTFVTVVIKRQGEHVSAVLLCRDALLVATVVVLPAALVFEAGEPITWSGRELFSIGYLAVVGTVLNLLDLLLAAALRPGVEAEPDRLRDAGRRPVARLGAPRRGDRRDDCRRHPVDRGRGGPRGPALSV